MTSPETGSIHEQLKYGLAHVDRSASEDRWQVYDLSIHGPEGVASIGRSPKRHLGLLIPVKRSQIQLPDPSRHIRMERTSLASNSDQAEYLAITCLEPENDQRFLLLCCDLLEQGPFHDAGGLSAAIEESVRRFRSLIYPAEAGDEKKAIGLLGELLFLKELGIDLGIQACQWRGPEQQARDFELDHCDVEVKTTGDLTAWRFHIHGLHQLARGEKPLLLVGLRISEAAAGGITLEELVAWLRRHGLGDIGAFEDRLEMAETDGCIQALGERRWTLRDSRSWLVTSEFPRIEPGLLEDVDSISTLNEVRYLLDLTLEPRPDAGDLDEIIRLIRKTRP